jgi:hypothetical protein
MVKAGSTLAANSRGIKRFLTPATDLLACDLGQVTLKLPFLLDEALTLKTEGIEEISKSDRTHISGRISKIMVPPESSSRYLKFQMCTNVLK